MKLHIAKDGDSIDALSKKYGVASERIRAANPQLSDAEPLTRGMKVKIPTGPVYMTSAEAAQPAPAVEGEANDAANEAAAEPVQAVAPSAAANATASVPEAEAVNDVLTSALPTAAESVPATKEGAEAKAVVSGTPYAAELPAPFPQADADANTLPAYYKTDLPAAGNLSPLHVPWSGMHDGPAEHPFAPLPTPVVPAGAPTYYPGPFGYGAAPAPFGAFGTNDPSTYATYGALPDRFPPAFPGPIPGAFPAAYPGFAVAAHDCGCGGPSTARLPYALPLRGGDRSEGERAFASAASAPAQPAPETASGAQQPAPEAAPTKSRPAKKKARVSSRDDALRSFLKRASGARRPSKRKSRPWVND